MMMLVSMRRSCCTVVKICVYFLSSNVLDLQDFYNKASRDEVAVFEMAEELYFGSSTHSCHGYQGIACHNSMQSLRSSNGQCLVTVAAGLPKLGTSKHCVSPHAQSLKRPHQRLAMLDGIKLMQRCSTSLFRCTPEYEAACSFRAKGLILLAFAGPSTAAMHSS